MREIVFDIGECYSPEEVHDIIAAEFDLPEYYGGNLDALADVLTEISGEYDITFKGCAGASVLVGSKFIRSLKRMSEAVMRENKGLKISFED